MSRKELESLQSGEQTALEFLRSESETLMFVPRFFSVATVALCGLLLSLNLFAQSPDVSQSSSATTDELPEAFSRRVPLSLEELKQIEEQVVKLVPKLRESTVSVRIGRAQGSGVIVSPDGYVLTAAHVSGEPGLPATVITADGRSHRGRTLGRNTTLDASLIKIESDRRDWVYSPVARDPAKAGDWCLVMGNPGGYQKERGAVLRVGRVIMINQWMIQTDCELVGGDSGGPLFNARGQVIGVNTRIGESTDVNLHVPAEVYLRDWQRLARSEDFRTHSGAFLGISGEPAPGGKGLVITRVHRGNAADRAGVRTGDILLTFDDEPVNSLQQLIQLVGESFPGESVELGLQRNGETLHVDARLQMKWDS